MASQAHDATGSYSTPTRAGFRANKRAAKFSAVTALCVAALTFSLLKQNLSGQTPPQTSGPLELSRTSRPWEFLSATGPRAGLLGNESGRMEAWVYPLKILRDFHLRFLVDGRVLPAESLARTTIVRPESSTIVYAGDTFTVRETFFVPINEQGALILLDVETEQPLEIEAAFHRDFQLEWPGALGGTYLDWDAAQNAFYFGEEQKKFAALLGSPTGVEQRLEYQTNYSDSPESSFGLGVIPKGKESKIIVIAGSMEGRADAEKTYQRLSTSSAELLREATRYYQTYLEKTVSIDVPDRQIQRAYDWARVGAIQGLVNNPFLGTGLVAGYRGSGESQRPGFAWFFGRDSFWTSLALTAAGDFSTSRTAIDFISKYQREDGKIPHEISQGASFVPWFKNYPYPYASADATPLYIIAVNDYVLQSGDVAFAKEKWDSLCKAYQFLRSTYDAQNFPQNFGFGHGWVEGGPLLPVKTELYQTGLGLEAIHALANLARLTGKTDASKDLDTIFERQKPLVNNAFWIADKNRFAFALDKDNKRVDELGVLATVPMWFGLLDPAKADSTITQLAGLDHQTDWGMRIISEHSPKFSGGGYHFGSVWPLFTGWAAVGEYRYHHEAAAYGNLRANALLTFDGSLGHVTEVLSGAYYQSLSTSSPHQIWSAAMVVSPVLRGMFGLAADTPNHTLTFAPHAPADWTRFAINNVQVGTVKLALHYSKDLDGITLEVKRSGAGDCFLEFEPVVSLRAQVLAVGMNGRAVPFHMAANDSDQHVLARFAIVNDANTIRIRLRDDFGISYSSGLPPLGSSSQGLRILSETWSKGRDTLLMNISGRPGHEYELSVWNASQITSMDGAELVKTATGESRIHVRISADQKESTSQQSITIHFAKKNQRKQ